MMRGTIDYKIPNQIPVPVGDRSGAKAIAHWLGNDIQYTMSSIDRWLAKLSAIVKGEAGGGYQGTGNAFSVYATELIVLIESEYIDSHKVCLTVAQVSAALNHYRTFLRSGNRSQGFQPQPFEVEFLAEEDQARECYLEHGGVLV